MHYFGPASAVGPGGGGIDKYDAAANPTANNDAVDTAGVGVLFTEGDMWYNTVTTTLWMCTDDSATAAVWGIIVLNSDTAVTDDVGAMFDGTSAQFVQNSAVSFAAGNIVAATAGASIQLGSAGNAIYADAAAAVGITGDVIYNDNAARSLQIKGAFASGAGNISVAIDADVNNATINATHKIASFGWINNADARTEMMYITGTGSVLWTADNVANIGAVATTRPANVYVGTSLNIGNGGFTASSTAVLGSSGAAITINDVNLILTTDSGGNCGAAADTRFANIYAATSFNVGNGGLAMASTGTITASGGDVIIGDDNLIWTTDGGGNIGAAGDNKPASIWATTLVNAPSLVGTTSATINTDLTIGALTTGKGISNTADDELELASNRADGAANVSVQITADVNNATINAAHKVLSVGWQNNVDAYAELASITGNGDFTVTGALIGATAAITTSATVATNLFFGALTTGLGVSNTADDELELVSARADGAGNKSVQITADVNNATINATHHVLSVGWQNNADAYTELVYLEGSGNLKWAADGGGDIGAAAANRPANIFASANINATTAIGIGAAYNWAATYSNRGYGVGTTTANLFNQSGDNALILAQEATARDAASAICIASVFDRNAASITNAATVRIHSFGWTNNVDAYTELAYVRADGLFHASLALRVAGDEGTGLANTVTFTNVINAPDNTQAVLGDYHVNGSAGVFHGWVKMYDGTTAIYVPAWHDA